MCYSAQVVQSFDRYVREFGANIDLHTFAKLYGQRLTDGKIKTSSAMDATFQADKSEEMQGIKAMVDEYQAQQVAKLGQELIDQRDRLAKAELILKTKVTKKATDDQRIATNKIKRAEEKLKEFQQLPTSGGDSRMFPGYYVPVMVVEDGKKIVRPMRYQCRIAGSPENLDTRFPGTYNARMDNLDVFWRNQFGHTHGIAIVSAFYEYVVDAQGKTVVLEFKPDDGRSMYVACLWSHWTAPGKDDLYSFAFITADPPAEVLAAGHDRCIVPIKRENVEYWLNPDPKDLDSLYDILEDRDRPFYEHRIAP